MNDFINSKARQWILKNFTAETGNAVTLFLYLANLGPIRTTGGLSQRESWAQTMLFWGQVSSPTWSGDKMHLIQDFNWLTGRFGIWFCDLLSDDKTKPEKIVMKLVKFSSDIYWYLFSVDIFRYNCNLCAIFCILICIWPKWGLNRKHRISRYVSAGCILLYWGHQSLCEANGP